MRLRNLVKLFFTAFIIFAGLICETSAQELILIDTANKTPNFTFGAFNNATLTPSSVGIVIELLGSENSFGGVGFNGANLDNRLIPAGDADILVTLRLDDVNSTDLSIVLREEGDDVGGGEFFGYPIRASSLPLGVFTTVEISAENFGFNGAADPGQGTGNGILDGTLRNVGIHSPFGGTGSQSITVRSVAIRTSAVPEPSSSLLLLAAMPLGVVRRRKTAY